ncbi:MAG: SRPBCC domain-containing protein [Bauldia sp.]|nr:SRPBCC domain-containing protein [Bauldia sp.]
MNAAVKIKPVDNEPTVVDYPDSEPIAVWKRVFHAPRELVWQAWTDPKHVEKWWGPRRYSTKVLELDLRKDGAWRFEQHGEDGSVITFYGRYLEVDAPAKLVNTFGVVDMFPDTGTETNLFEDLGNGTTAYTGISNFGDFAIRDAQRGTGMEEGGIESFDRFAEYLATLTAKKA